jgi:Mg2+ and Co2+ transporter CorA
LSDNGRYLPSRPHFPWTEEAQPPHPDTCFMGRDVWDAELNYCAYRNRDFYTFDPHEESEWLNQTGASAIKQEPYLLVGRLLQLATMSLAKVIHVMEEDVAACQQAEADESAVASTQLRFTLALLGPLRTYIADNLSIIQDQPRVHHLRTFTDLKKDLDYLLTRTEILSNRCDTIADTLLSTMSILESQKSVEQSQMSIAQSRQINKLTRLAFVYIPLSFVSSVFGMNVREIQADPSIWVFFVTAVSFTLLSVCVVSWQNIRKWASAFATCCRKIAGRDTANSCS